MAFLKVFRACARTYARETGLKLKIIKPLKWQDLNKDKGDSEKYLDDYLVKEVKKMGGLCLKLVAVSWFGFPDRTILLPFGRIYFIELKSKGKTPKPRQAYVHKILRGLGFRVDWVDNIEALKHYIDNTLYGISGSA